MAELGLTLAHPVQCLRRDPMTDRRSSQAGCGTTLLATGTVIKSL
jgi:hypothetical protein